MLSTALEEKVMVEEATIVSVSDSEICIPLGIEVAVRVGGVKEGVGMKLFEWEKWKVAVGVKEAIGVTLFEWEKCNVTKKCLE
jgi:hypothetical protein